MAITYEWKITALKKAASLDGLSDVVTHVNFEYTGTDASGNKGVFNGACPIGDPDKDADVIEWAKANHPVDHMNEVIDKQISDNITPKNVEADMPWAPAESPPAEEE